jgi:ribosome-binding protein aMBF1 (putative translation factor)
MKSDNLKNFQKLVSNERSGWFEKAKWNVENEVWLEKSAKIAARILHEIRAQKPINGMTQKMLAEKMNVTPQHINKIVKGQENLTLETISRIEQVLGVTLVEVSSFL